MGTVIGEGNASGQYAYDGSDLWDYYGYFVNKDSTALSDILSFPESKEVYSKSWRGENGAQYDLTKRFFNDQIVTLSGYLIGNNKADFWQKRNSFWAALKAVGQHTLHSFELEQDFGCFYVSSKAEKMTRIRENSDKVAMKLDLTFRIIYSELVNPGTKTAQTIVFPAIPTKVFGDPDFMPTVSATSGLGVVLSSSNTAVATVSGSTVHLVAPGVTTLYATQNGNSTYDTAVPKSQLLVVVDPAASGQVYVIDRTVATYAAMVSMMAGDSATIVYEYKVLADETNGGVISHYTHYNNHLTFFVEGDA